MYLSKSLQLSNSFAVEGQNLATIVIKKLSKDNNWPIWGVLGRYHEEKEVFRSRRSILSQIPKKFNVPESSYFPSILKEFSEKVYFEVYDQSISGLRKRLVNQIIKVKSARFNSEGII